MPKKLNKQMPLFKPRLGRKKTAPTNQRLKLAVLITLLISIVAAQMSGLYAYVYNYAKCKEAPLEVRGEYYRLPSDENYGIHMGSDYSRCYDGPLPNDLQRDPLTQAGMKIAALKEKDAARLASVSDYTVYKPEGFEISSYRQSDNGDRFETQFTIKTGTGTEFDVSEMKKGSSYDYIKTCYAPPTENWSGTIIGVDAHGREICKTNLSKFVTKYTVGIHIGESAIILRTNSTSEALLNDEVSKIFSSMKPSL